MRIAVVGASGFVGRHLIRAGVASGHEMVGVVRKAEAQKAVARLGGTGTVVEGLSDPRLPGSLAGAATVVHLAQVSAERGAATYEAVNVQGTRALLDASQRAGVGRVILFSGLGVARYGIAPFSTNGYFLSKLAAEVELFRSGLHGIVFRPSYILGAGDALLPVVVEDLAKGDVEIIGDGSYRLQPVAVADAVAAVLEAAGKGGPLVFDLVGPEPLSWVDFVRRAAGAAARRGMKAEARFRHVPVAEARSRAAHGGYRGLQQDEVDVVLCDEVSDHRRLEALVGRPLLGLDEALDSALRGLSP